MSGVAAHIPLALSLLQTVASQYPGFQKSQSTTNVAPSAPAGSSLLATALSSLPTFQSSSQPPQSSQGASSSSSTSTPPATSTSALCENCHFKPKYNDGRKIHPYCSKSCAKAKAGGTSSNNDCDFCHSRPKYAGHPFCSKTCARNAVASSGSSGSPSGMCQAPGCQKPAHSNADYCSRSHKILAETVCLMCLQQPKLAHSNFCGKKCEDDAEKRGPMILEVPAGHVTFKSVADQFKSSWRHAGTTCPPVKHVYKVIVTQTSLSAYNTYKDNVEARGQFVTAGRSEGNENRRWHGTRRECQLGDKGQTQFCTLATCSLCCILRNSFDIGLWGKKTGWGRFGKGIYTSSTSSKSNDYSHNVCKSNLKAILLNKVVVGKGCKMTHDSTSLTAPPSGYDSVLAEKGGSLNYDELVVYTNDAIRPSYLVMYEA
ncbi:ADP-ribosylation [Marasmius fiardii PR-910]|nr:ADP-ribosylation [Marasmius fiardii PR-910]